MAKLNLDGQIVTIDGKVLRIRLREPFWSAWQRFGWEQNDPGFGIGDKIIDYLKDNKKTLHVIYKDSTYKISMKKINKVIDTYYPYFSTNSGVRLLVIPRSHFTRIAINPAVQAINPLFVLSDEQRAKLRKKLFGETSKKGGFV